MWYSTITPVLSSSVANALRVFFPAEAISKADFIDKFDKLFDLLNVSNYTSRYKSLKEFKMPYRLANDFRIQVTLIYI